MSDALAREAAQIFLETQSALFNAREPFQYTSGNIGPIYMDCRRLISFPKERARMMDMAVARLEQEIGFDNIDVIAGGETAGIPYAAFIAERANKSMIYVRKKPKGHGRMGQIEGYLDEKATPRVLLIEDLQNFGASKKVFIDALRAADADVAHFFVIFNYGTRPEVDDMNAEMGLTGHALCTWHDVLAVARAGNYFDAETLNSVEDYLNNSAAWVERFNDENNDAA